MNINIKPEIPILEIAGKGFDLIKYITDKKADVAIHHDDTMKEINAQDHAGKTARLKLVAELVTPLVAAGAFYLKRKGQKISGSETEDSTLPPI